MAHQLSKIRRVGTGDLDESFVHELAFWPVFVRVHFVRTGGVPGVDTADLELLVASLAGSAWNTRLYTVPKKGVGADVNFRIPRDEREEWHLSASDGLRVFWSNPDPGNIEWGLEAGFEYVDRHDQ